MYYAYWSVLAIPILMESTDSIIGNITPFRLSPGLLHYFLLGSCIHINHKINIDPQHNIHMQEIISLVLFMCVCVHLLLRCIYWYCVYKAKERYHKLCIVFQALVCRHINVLALFARHHCLLHQLCAKFYNQWTKRHQLIKGSVQQQFPFKWMQFYILGKCPYKMKLKSYVLAPPLSEPKVGCSSQAIGPLF